MTSSVHAFFFALVLAGDRAAGGQILGSWASAALRGLSFPWHIAVAPPPAVRRAAAGGGFTPTRRQAAWGTI